MKKYLIIAILLLIKHNSNAQAGIEYDTCNFLQQYVGEWKYINGQDTIRIYLKYARTIGSYLTSVKDNLWGWVDYKSGSVIKESNYQYRFDSIPYNSDSHELNKFPIFLSLWNCNNSSSIKFVGAIRDSAQEGEFHVVTATLDPTKTIMTWRQHHSEGYGAFTGARGMTLPKTFVLIKQ